MTQNSLNMSRLIGVSLLLFGGHLLYYWLFLQGARLDAKLVHGLSTVSSLDDTAWDLDVLRSRLALAWISTGTAPEATVYNSTFVIFVIQFVYRLFATTDHNFLCIAIFQAAVYAASVFPVHATLRLLAPRYSTTLTLLFLALTVYPYHVDTSLEGFRSLLLAISVWASAHYCAARRSRYLGFLFCSLFVITLLSSPAGLVTGCIAFAVMPSLVHTMRKPSRSPAVSVLPIFAVIVLAFGISIAASDVLWGTNKLLQVIGYAPTALDRSSDDLSDTLASIKWATGISQDQSGLGRLIFCMYGLFFPGLNHVMFSGTDRLAVYGAGGAAFVLIKNLTLAIILLRPQVWRLPFIIVPAALFVVIPFFWGPHPDTLRYSSLLLPLLILQWSYLAGFVFRGVFFCALGLVAVPSVAIFCLSLLKNTIVLTPLISGSLGGCIALVLVSLALVQRLIALKLSTKPVTGLTSAGLLEHATDDKNGPGVIVVTSFGKN